MCKFCEGHAPLITTGCVSGFNIDVGIYGNKLIAEANHDDEMGITSTMTKACVLNYCPMCGEKIGGK